LPVPVTAGAQAEVCDVEMEAGEQVSATEVIVGGTVTVTLAEPDLVESCVEVAWTVAMPAASGVKTPVLLTAPMFAGLTDHATEALKLPVPVTAGAQVEVCDVEMEAGEQVTATEVIVSGTVTVTVVEPDLVESCVEVALMVSEPKAGALAGAVYCPELEIVPETADQVTLEL
jgi:hypothetical protein